jgi:acyl-CoA thioester hydrolase
MASKDFVWGETVRIYDTDTEGIAHYAGYYRFFTDAFEQFAKNRLLLDWPLVNNRVWFVVVESYARYYKPLRLGDRMRTHVNVEIVGKKALAFNFRIYKNAAMVCEGKIVQVAIDRRAWKAVQLPKSIVAKVKSFNKES